jgi:hypothetical protein
MPGSRPVPDLDIILVVIGKILVGGDEPELFEDMLHDGAGHHHPDIVAFRQPLPEKGLSMALIFFPGYDVMEVEQVVIIYFQPPGEELFGKTQDITRGCAGLDSLCGHLDQFLLGNLTMGAGRI